MLTLEKMRKRGSFAQLSDGATRYEVAGPKNGQPVVLVHGLMGHMHVWDHNFQFLVEQGYRVLRFDLYGRGLSERLKKPHGSELFLSQLADLTQHVNFNGPFHLVGISMGGAISVRYASHHPDRIRSLFLVDSYGIPTPDAPGIRIVQPKLLGEAFIGTLGGPILRRAPIRGIYDKEKHPDFARFLSVSLRLKGSKRALLSTLRHFMLEDQTPHFRRVNHLSFPKMILWGKEDEVLPYAYGQQVRALMPNARFEVFEQCGHVPQFERPEKFNSLCTKFLSGD